MVIIMKKVLSLVFALVFLYVTATAESAKKNMKIKFAEKNIILAPGTYYQLKPIIEANDASNPDLVWVSSNDKVASVDSEGKVSGITKGNAKITVSFADNHKVKASVTVKVNQFDLVFTSKKPQKLKYSYSGSGTLKIRGTVKNGNVSIPNIDTDSYVSVMGRSTVDEVRVTPVHPGLDVVTLKINGKKHSYSIFVADYFADHETQYVMITDTSPHDSNGSFRDIIYGTPYSEIKDMLVNSYGNDFEINDYQYYFQIFFKNPRITVAGHDVSSIMFEFCYDEDKNGFISKDETTASFYRAVYTFDSEENDLVAENLHLKLNDLYGKSSEESHYSKEQLELIGLDKLSWRDNDIYIDLDNSNSLTVSYLWGKGFSKRQELKEIYEDLKELEIQQDSELEQGQFNPSTDGL